MPAPSRRRSLWALPATADAARFVPTIERLAAEVGSDPFPPHITLLGDAGDVDALPDIGAFSVRLVALADSDERYRCITLTAESDELFALRSAVGGTTSDYEPHLSLLYAELLASRRAELRKTVDLDLPMTITIDAVALVDTSDNVFTRWTRERTWPLG
jgi:2'-5' RNA ligase